ncbi:MAG: hypothetical protein VX939_09745 [Pseudomonadota bacterium]|nr:hypothetical protein [Pseudomonadota bacterium]
MSIVALVLSLVAVTISALSYYRTHHHVSKKLYAFITMSTSFFENNELPVAILNAGNRDVILIGYSISMRMKSGIGSLSRGADKALFDSSFKGLLNPGNGTVATVKFDTNYDKTLIENCGTPNDKGKFSILYDISISWCDSSGRRFRAESPLASIVLDDTGTICGYGDVEEHEINLYQCTK